MKTYKNFTVRYTLLKQESMQRTPMFTKIIHNLIKDGAEMFEK